MKVRIILLIMLLALPLVTYAGSGVYKGCYYETRDEISIVVSGDVSKNGEANFVYRYILKSNPQSKQNVWLLDIDLPEKEIIINATAPNVWDASWSGKTFKISPETYEALNVKPWPEDLKPEIKPPYSVRWFPDEEEGMLKPSETISGLTFATSYGVPGIVEYYAEGWASFPRCEGELDESDEGKIPGYHDLTPYGPGLVGRTLGPTAPPKELMPVDFLNNIISMKHEAFKLGWITEKGIEMSFDQKLDAALKKLQSGNSAAAKNILKAFIKEVEAQGCESYEAECPPGKHLKPEAYALLKYNTQYLIDNMK